MSYTIRIFYQIHDAFITIRISDLYHQFHRLKKLDFNTFSTLTNLKVQKARISRSVVTKGYQGLNYVYGHSLIVIIVS